MAVFETWLKSDLKKPVNVKNLEGHIFSQDNQGNLIGVEVMDDGYQAVLDGEVAGHIIRADGMTVVVEGTLSDNKATIILPAAAYAVVGQIMIAIKVGSTTVGACVGYVYRTTTDTIVDPGTIIPSVEDLLTAIENAVESIPSDYSTLSADVAGLKTRAQMEDYQARELLGEKTINTTLFWERGGIDETTGEDYSNYTKLYRTKTRLSPEYVEKVTAAEGYRVRAFLYDAETDEFVSAPASATEIDLRQYYGYNIRFLIAKSDGSNIENGAGVNAGFLIDEKAVRKRTDERENEYVEEKSGAGFENLYIRGFYNPGYGIERANGNTSVNNGAFATDFIEIKPDTLYCIYPTYTSTKYGAAFYDANKTYLYGYGTDTDRLGVVYARSTAKYIRFTNTIVNEHRVSLRKVSDAYPYNEQEVSYFGEKISFLNQCKYRLIMTISKSTWGSSQGGSIYGDYLFTFSNNLETGWVLNLLTKQMQTLTYTGEAVDNHANCVYMSGTFYDENDPYPLVYISSERAHFCGIYRFTVDENENISYDEVGRITYDAIAPEDNRNCYIDFENKYFYANAMIDGVYSLVKYNLPSAYTGTIELENAEYDATLHPNGYLRTFHFETVFTKTAATENERIYRQDAFITNGKLYLGTGGRQSASINVIDLHSGKVISFVDLAAGGFSQEIESVTKYHDTIIIYYNDGNVYQYRFD